MILDRLLGPAKLATKSGSWPVSQVPGELFRIRESGAGVEVSEDDALSLSAVFAAVNLLARITAALPLNVYRKTGTRRDVAAEHPVQRLLHTEYNPEMTAVVGRRTEEFHRLLGGNGYTEIQWAGSGMPRALWPLEWWRVKPQREKESKALYYLVDGTRRVQPRDMLHCTLTSADGVCGLSFLDYAFESLGVGIAAQTFAARFFGSGARPGVILKHPGPGNPDPKQRTEMVESWDRAYGGGPKQSNKTAALWGGWEVSEYGGGLSPGDSQLLESRRFAVEEVARWLNVPPHILRDLSRSTNNNIEHQGIEFVQLTLGPTLVEREQEYDRKLLDPPNLYSKHNVTSLLRGDSKARAEWYTKMFSVGGVTINTILELEEQNPIGPDGDVHFVPVNLQPLERALKEPEPPPPVRAPAPLPEEPEDDEQEEPPPAMRAALRSLLADTFGRLLRKETNAGRRAAAKPGEFLAWLDSFYPDFEQTLTDALRGPMDVRNALRAYRTDFIGDKAAAVEYCQRSRESLLDLAGRVKAPELAAAVEQEFAQWESNRAANEAARLLGG